MKPLTLLALAALAGPAFAGTCDHANFTIKATLTDAKMNCPMVVGLSGGDCTLSGGTWAITSIDEDGMLGSNKWSPKVSADPAIVLPAGASGCGSDFHFDFKLDVDHPTYLDQASGKQVSYSGKITGAQAEAVFVDPNGNANAPVKTAAAEKDKHILVTVPPAQLLQGGGADSPKLIIRFPGLDGQTIKLLSQG